VNAPTMLWPSSIAFEVITVSLIAAAPADVPAMQAPPA
jgi:hypothetical protein